MRALLAAGRDRLRAAGLESPSREAALLLRHLLGMSEAALLARDRDPVAPAVADRFRTLLDLRARGVPAAHLLGEREFWGRPFAVDDRVLVPRPETEHLVEIALELPLADDARVLDIGTGSGCLAVTLQAERPRWRVVATDLSPAALAVARRNAERILGEGRLGLVGCDLGAALRLEAFDLVVANPPYVDAASKATLPLEVREYEPRIALFPPGPALAILERLLAEGLGLRTGARLALEIGAGQADAIVVAARRIGGWEFEQERRDLAGHRRDLLLRRID